MSLSKYWPDDNTVAPSVAHKMGMNPVGSSAYPNGRVPWTAGRAPDLTTGHNLYTTGRLRSCGYCGSMHPTDVVAALKAGARLEGADRKYGWPHKFYLHGVPNPHEGQRCSVESRGYGSEKGAPPPADPGEWIQLASPQDLEQKKPEFVTYSWHKVSVERPTTWGKFYTEHLLDASPEEKDFIERHFGLHIDLERADGKIAWWPYGQAKPVAMVKGE
jgi:hypothetical protein